ncbi:MAG: 1-acyl-sn-glycerol-3-phosphate acyltransferase [Muribaculaceae bacterium]|nr:1-acyl-sn-glycerol-3-phosphate acyltransferase [Muribaculaceae bacterium]
MMSGENSGSEAMQPDAPMQIDLDAILKARVPKGKRWLVSRPVTALLERLVRQKDLNRILREAYPAEGCEFARRVLEIQNIEVKVQGLEKLERGKRYIFASNHPLGGLDGITLIAVLGDLYGDEGIWFLVNDLLMNVAPLKPVFLPINKFGGQGRAAASAINDAYASAAQIVIFPAGLVSRKQPEGIKDLTWQKAFVAKAMEFDRDIVPVHFKALNSSFFYNVANWRKQAGVKVNVEQVLLPSELCKASGKHFEIVFGDPISVEYLRASGESAPALAARIREMVYTL